MGNILFSNNATSTLAGSISAVATTANLSAGTGALFPSPTGSEYFTLTFTDADTGLLKEIVHVTGRATDTITMVRAQEGTAAQTWAAGDIAANLITAGSLNDYLQSSDVLSATGAYAVDAGSANSISITLSPVPASYAAILGVPIRVNIAADNTGNTTFAVVSLGSLAVKNPDGSQMAPGQLQAGGIAMLVYDGTAMQLQSITKQEQPHGSVLLTASSGNWTVPLGVTSYDLEIWAGGGSGGTSGVGNTAGAGGGAGEYLLALDVAATPGASIPYTCGAGGAAPGGTASGVAGGNTTWNTATYVAHGGSGGTGAAIGPGAQVGGNGGTGGSASMAIAGGSGSAGGGGTVGSLGGFGGAAPRGGPGGNNSVGTAGNGVFPGGGGAGGGEAVSSIGGAGANGAILVRW